MKRNSHLHKEKKHVDFLHAGRCLCWLQRRFFISSPRGRENGNSSGFSKNLKDHLASGVRGQGTRLSGGVGAGTGAVTPATRRSGTRAAACGGPPPRGAGPARTYKFFFVFFKGVVAGRQEKLNLKNQTVGHSN